MHIKSDKSCSSRAVSPGPTLLSGQRGGTGETDPAAGVATSAPQRASGGFIKGRAPARLSHDRPAACFLQAGSGPAPTHSSLPPNTLTSPHCIPRPPKPEAPCPTRAVPTSCCFLRCQFPSDGNACPVTGDRRKRNVRTLRSEGRTSH